MSLTKVKKFLAPFTEEQSNTILAKLIAGDAGVKLARLIQKDFKQYKDTGEASLVQRLKRCRDDLKEEKVHISDLLEYGKDVAEIEEKIDAIAVQSDMVVLQKERVLKAIKKEKSLGDTGLLMKQVTDQLYLINSQLKTLSDMQSKVASKKYIGSIEQTTTSEEESEGKNQIAFEVTQDVMAAIERFDNDFGSD